MAKKFAIINLGCPKNLVDGEGMQQKLIEAGYEETNQLAQADAIIVNTCGFIDKAKEESIQVLLEVAAIKTSRQKLIAAGCLSERYADDLAREIPELDGILGTRRWHEIASLLDRAAVGERQRWTGNSICQEPFRRRATSASAYVKIADGCSVGCAFCSIPKIKGPHVSKSMRHVIDEVRQLADQGVKEIVLVAQNSTAYGHDWGDEDALASLLDRIAEEVPQIAWIRLMYAFPSHITTRLIDTIANNTKVIKYIDMPLQHADPTMLRLMRRPTTSPMEVIRRLRQEIPQIAIRSAFIVGHPGEGEREFASLLSFLEQAELDRVGVFTYSPEEGTLAVDLPRRVSKRIAQKRYERVMELQQGISLKRNRSFVGKRLDVLIESVAEGKIKRLLSKRLDGQLKHDGEIFIGRSYRDAPEVDGVVYAYGRTKVGEIVPVTIIEAMEYDLIGEIIELNAAY